MDIIARCNLPVLCKTTCMTVGVYYATAGLRYRSQCAACWKSFRRKASTRKNSYEVQSFIAQSRVGLQPTLVCQTAIVVKKTRKFNDKDELKNLGGF